MSKIFDALKQAELEQAELAPLGRKDSATNGRDTSRQPERRRTRRICVYVPLFVYGYTGDNPFHEDACIVAINAHGGLISMQTAVLPGQKLLLINKRGETTHQCVVLSVRARRERVFDVGFEFPGPMPQFRQNLEIGTSSHSEREPRPICDLTNL